MSTEVLTQRPTIRVSSGGPLRVRFWLAPVAFAALAAISLGAGFASAQNTAYWSSAQVFGDFMNSPVRILFPIVAALLAGADMAAELSNRGIVNTRVREDVRRHLARVFMWGLVRAFAVFALLTLVCAVAAFVIVPAAWPHAIDPGGYELKSPAAVYAADVAIAPLTATMSSGWVAFALVTALWSGVNAAAFGLLALICVVLIPRTVLALLIPGALYLAESAAFMFLGLPGPSFLISAVYPSGLQHYSLTQAAAPSLILIALTVTGAVLIILRARTSSRMS